VTMNEKGYIKFNCHWIKSNPINEEKIYELNAWREKLFKLKLIGLYPNGIGYGNISIRLRDTVFLITGTATGQYPVLNVEHYTEVISFNFKENIITCKGPIKASSESLTHAAIYETEPEANAVIHVHNLALWKKLLNKVPTSAPEVEYGTPEMAVEIQRLFTETNLGDKKILAMGGHEEGVISFGKTIDEAGKILMDLV
jgi:L-ribulose-5-phosphate 4-epimerase